jgi:hypothetical protein
MESVVVKEEIEVSEQFIVKFHQSTSQFSLRLGDKKVRSWSH